MTKQKKKHKISEKATIKGNKAFGLVVFATLIVLILDQASKAMIDALFLSYEQIEILPIFNIIITWNYGISFGMNNNTGQDQMPIALLSMLILVALWVWTSRQRHLAQVTKVAIGLISGGAISNLVDRLHYGAVLDFLDFHLGEYHWPAFNIADSAIVIGVLLWLFWDRKEN